jgi:hypothetical protein
MCVISCKNPHENAGPSLDEYAFYNTLIDSVYKNSPMNPEYPEVIVIEDSTSLGLSGAMHSFAKPVKPMSANELREIVAKELGRIVPDVAWIPLLESFDKCKRIRTRLLVSDFSRKEVLVLLSHDSVRSIFSNGGWNNFYKIFPHSDGMILFSRVGFNQAHTEALVYYEHSRGDLDAVGARAVFKIIGGNWKLVRILQDWVS